MRKIPLKTNQNNPRIQEYKEAVERGKQNQHVLPRGKAWVVKRAGAEKVSQIFDTQREASDYAHSLAKNHGTAVFIHGSNGRIRERKDYYSA